MSYREALDFIYSRLPMFQRIGPAAYKADLGTTIALCDALGHPYHGIPCVHVAGSNGKGSVCSMLAASFSSAGYKTGLFTSPHLIDYRERIRIDGLMISQDFVASFISENVPLFERLKPSFFEVSFVMAAEWFRQQAVDIIVWETGMGGRLDSTNLVTPLVSVITNISFDHTQFLGDTLEKIAAEKAGIIKRSIPVIIGERQTETDKVFIDKAASMQAEITFAGDRWRSEVLGERPFNNELSLDVWNDGTLKYAGLHCGLSGRYQQKNVITALAALDYLSPLLQVNESHIRVGFREVAKLSGIEGRWMRISESPPAYCDTGHNAAGIAEVIGMLNLVPKQKLRIVFGMVDDKDAGPVMELLPGDAEYYFCQASVPRAMPLSRLVAEAARYGLQGLAVGDCHLAYLKAIEDSATNDFVFVGGSTFVVADVLQGLKSADKA